MTCGLCDLVGAGSGGGLCAPVVGRASAAAPDGAAAGVAIDGLIDFHVHSAPSLAPRHSRDPETLEAARAAGVAVFVLKAHEGSTAERADLLGAEAVGGVVLNSPVGGANPDAVAVAARLGARVAWLPTISSPAHIAAFDSPELAVHRGISFRPVPVVDNSEVRREWLEVFDEVARSGMVLASGHLRMDEAAVAFDAARSRGVDRLLVNHPGLAFLGWRDDHAGRFRRMGAHLEVGVLADLLAGPGGPTTEDLVAGYPHDLLVFGSDLGHRDYPPIAAGIRAWVERLAPILGDAGLEQVARASALGLLAP